MQPAPLQEHKAKEVLTVYDDGKMSYRNRFINRDEVVIYPDGFGGEHAAVKVRIPGKPDFYRDSITVDRVNAGHEPTIEEDHGKLN